MEEISVSFFTFHIPGSNKQLNKEDWRSLILWQLCDVPSLWHSKQINYSTSTVLESPILDTWASKATGKMQCLQKPQYPYLATLNQLDWINRNACWKGPLNISCPTFSLKTNPKLGQPWLCLPNSWTPLKIEIPPPLKQTISVLGTLFVITPSSVSI